MRPKPVRITMLALAAVAAWLVIRSVFFFNPLTFHHDDVTFLPWSFYKRPMQVEYSVLSGIPSKRNAITDEAEVEFVIQELKKGLQGPSPDLNFFDLRGTEWVRVDMVSTHSRIAVLPLIGYLDQGVLWLRPGDKPPVPVRLTPALKELLSRRFAEAKRV